MTSNIKKEKRHPITKQIATSPPHNRPKAEAYYYYTQYAFTFQGVVMILKKGEEYEQRFYSPKQTISIKRIGGVVMSILHKFFDGHIKPWDQLMPEQPGYRDSCIKTGMLRDRLIETLNKEEQKLLSEFEDARAKSVCMEITQAFVDGFRLGSLFSLDTTKPFSDT